MTSEKPRVDVVFASDARFIPHWLATAVSFLEANKEFYDTDLWLITDDSDHERVGIASNFLSGRWGVELHIVEIQPALLQGFHVSGHVSPMAYARLLLGSLLPPSVQTALYLDSDLLVFGPLCEVFAVRESLLRDGIPLAAVPEDNGAHLSKFGFSGEGYFNSGVLLVNLDAWRLQGVEERFEKVALEHGSELIWWDQDVLNLVLDRSWMPLPSRYNCGNSARFTRGVWHFTGSVKPWMAGGDKEAREVYNSFRAETPFFPYRLEGVKSFLIRELFPQTLRRPRKSFRRFRRRLARRVASVRLLVKK